MTDLHIDAALLSDVGRKRSMNQDCGLIGHGLFLVCDGMGGGVAGQEASSRTLQRFDALAQQPTRSKEMIGATFETAQQETLRLGAEYGGVAGTTATGLILADASALADAADDDDGFGFHQRLGHETGDGNVWYVVNVGDSRTYHLGRTPDGSAWEASSLVQITRDHSRRQEVIDTGAMLPELAEQLVPRNIITQCVGAPEGIEPDFFRADLTGRFIVCSDGLHSEIDNASIAAIAAAHETPQDAVNALVAAALDAGGRDNVTVIVVDVTKADGHDGITDDDAGNDDSWSYVKIAHNEDIFDVDDSTLDTLRTVTARSNAGQNGK
ncbi:serine/threonine-protein phosphatase [Bifidobacterium sp. SMB2]|uniref:Serine/threonine-protein phosphatase n=1 Tax=Bifidobacterium saimiriisciurei TaxID=2661627 RepID=A0ABX0CB41_9BIFI|nr:MULTISPECIES: serine/threonine-protein phosphatase [Bifidobacterium]NEG96756.1 serine/threonine-protein phosphatase [Bifidobacterium sp. SMB2]NEH12322.1 serine/threonine-protein phosphatase [Bifidobacterium saimiriisciurei]